MFCLNLIYKVFRVRQLQLLVLKYETQVVVDNKYYNKSLDTYKNKKSIQNFKQKTLL